jgi:hypothetical protein
LSLTLTLVLPSAFALAWPLLLLWVVIAWLLSFIIPVGLLLPSVKPASVLAAGEFGCVLPPSTPACCCCCLNPAMLWFVGGESGLRDGVYPDEECDGGRVELWVAV